MKFFTKFFNSIKNRSSVNFSNNLFFIKQMLSVNITHTLKPHLFLPVKTLKIKYIKNNFNILWIKFISIISIITLFISLVFYL